MDPKLAASVIRQVCGENPTGPPVYEALKITLLRAEKEGRVLWRELEESRTHEKLNVFLKGHGYSSMPRELVRAKVFSPTEVEKWGEKIGLKVLW